MALTDMQIRSVKPSGKTQKLFDGRRMYIEVSSPGGKWWRLKYRFRGKETRLSLGVYPDVTLEDARQRREEMRTLIINGVDPSEHSKAEKASSRENGANSFEIIAREWFDKHSTNWATSHAVRIIRRLERNLFPWIGGSPIARSPRLRSWTWPAASSHVVPWRRHTVPPRTDVRCSAMRWPPDALNATPRAICAVPCPQSGASTLPP